MTILIKGMEMPPKGQGRMFLYDDNTAVWLNLDTGERIAYEVIPVPTPHGRLGDLDRLYKHIKVFLCGKPTIGFEDGNKVLKIIADTRTVIEAEEE